MYTSNAIDSLNMQIRKVIKNRGRFPNDEAATKLIWPALRNIATNWKMRPSYRIRQCCGLLAALTIDHVAIELIEFTTVD